MNIFELIIAKPFVGNAHSDQSLMDELHTIAVDGEVSMCHRIAALQRVDEIMGIENEPEVTEMVVHEYTTEFE